MFGRARRPEAVDAAQNIGRDQRPDDLALEEKLAALDRCPFAAQVELEAALAVDADADPVRPSISTLRPRRKSRAPSLS